jgi:DNA polymerase III delta prime subunit
MGSCSSSAAQLSPIKSSTQATEATKKSRKKSDECYMYKMLFHGPPQSGKSTLFTQLTRYEPCPPNCWCLWNGMNGVNRYPIGKSDPFEDITHRYSYCMIIAHNIIINIQVLVSQRMKYAPVDAPYHSFVQHRG